LLEVDEQHPNLSGGDSVTHGDVHPVAVVIRERQRIAVHNANEARIATLVRTVRPSLGIDRCKKEHVSGGDELSVVLVDEVVYQTLLDSVGEAPRVESVLQCSLCIVEERTHDRESRRALERLVAANFTQWPPPSPFISRSVRSACSRRRSIGQGGRAQRRTS